MNDLENRWATADLVPGCEDMEVYNIYAHDI